MDTGLLPDTSARRGARQRHPFILVAVLVATGGAVLFWESARISAQDRTLEALYARVSALQVPPKVGCVNNIHVVDSQNHHCEWYNANPTECGIYDTQNFSAFYDCCGCDDFRDGDWTRIAKYRNITQEMVKKVNDLDSQVKDLRKFSGGSSETVLGKVAALESRLSKKLSENNKQLDDSINKAKRDLQGDLNSQNDTLNKKIDHAQATVSDLIENDRNRFSTLTESINQVRGTVNGIQRTMAGEQGQINQVKGTENGIQRTMAGEQGQINQVKRTMNGIQSGLNSERGIVQRLENGCVLCKSCGSSWPYNHGHTGTFPLTSGANIMNDGCSFNSGARWNTAFLCCSTRPVSVR